MPKKLGSGTGSLYYDKNKDKWIVQRYINDYVSGKSKRKIKSFNSQEEANNYLSILMYQKENPIFIKNNGIPANEIMKLILQKKFDANLIGERQYLRVSKTIEKIEESYVSKKNIEEISPDELQGYLNTLKDYSNSYIKKIYEQYSQTFKYAMDKGYIRRNPMSEVIKPKSNKQDKIVRSLDIDEQQKFTDYLLNTSLKKEPYKNVFLIQLYMGLRIGETLALTTHDIDLVHKLLRVNKTLTTDKNENVIVGNSTKTYAGIRDLPIPQFVEPYIIEQMKLVQTNENQHLFLSSNGKLVDPRNANVALKRILKNNFGITDITTHSLRHTYGTRCVEAGMRAVALQRLMGHTDVSITLNTYTTVFNKYKQSELDKVNSYYMDNNLLSNTTIALPDRNIDNNILKD